MIFSFKKRKLRYWKCPHCGEKIDKLQNRAITKLLEHELIHSPRLAYLTVPETFYRDENLNFVNCEVDES